MGTTEELDNLRAELRSLKSKIAGLEGNNPDDPLECVKELNCLYKLSRLQENREMSVDDFLQSAVEIIISGFKHPESTCARISIGKESFVTGNFRETKLTLSKSIYIDNDPAGILEIFFYGKTPESDKTPYIREEQDMVDAISGSLGRYLQRKRSDQNLKKIEWMLGGKNSGRDDYIPKYGDLSLLNKKGLILPLVGKDRLKDIASESLDLLETSAAIYERNGEYALGLFSSGWCRIMDAASRELCNTSSNIKALDSGKWLCHDSCWKDAALKTMKTGKPLDTPCNGGINLYTVPVRAGGEIVGAVNFGYGDPPKEISKLKKLSRMYSIPLETLVEQANAYQSRPQFIIDLAKRRIRKSADHIGYIIDNKLSERAVRESEAKYRTVFENTGTAMNIIEKDGTISLANEKFSELAGYSLMEIQNKKTWMEFVLPDDLQRMQELHISRRKSKGKELLEHEFRFVNKDGGIRNIHFTIDFIPGTDQRVASLLDITGHKEKEKELREMKANLEVLVEEQTRELKVKVSELERFHEATIDREFRIKELRDEIETLRQKPEKDKTGKH